MWNDNLEPGKLRTENQKVLYFRNYRKSLRGFFL
jgi:hypothetical protein